MCKYTKYGQTCDSSNLLQTHLVGAIIHGIKTVTYVDVLQWRHDSNLAVNCLLRALVRASRNGDLPPTMYIQLDNCGRENKNKFFMGVVAMLVAKLFVTEAFMCFLMVGHTHEGTWIICILWYFVVC